MFFGISLFFLNFNQDINIFLIIIFLVNFISYFLLNIKNKSFLGSSGNVLLAVILYNNAVSEYNRNINFDILYLMNIFYLPFIDAVRLFFIRALQKKSPFTPDRQHLHHLIVDNKRLKKIYLLIFFFMISTPPFFLYFLKINSIITLFLSIITYFFIIFTLKKY